MERWCEATTTATTATAMTITMDIKHNTIIQYTHDVPVRRMCANEMENRWCTQWRRIEIFRSFEAFKLRIFVTQFCEVQPRIHLMHLVVDFVFLLIKHFACNNNHHCRRCQSHNKSKRNTFTAQNIQLDESFSIVHRFNRNVRMHWTIFNSAVYRPSKPVATDFLIPNFGRSFVPREHARAHKSTRKQRKKLHSLESVSTLCLRDVRLQCSRRTIFHFCVQTQPI